MTEHPDSGPGENANNPLRFGGHVSRRNFLRAVGATVVGSVAAPLSLTPPAAYAATLPIAASDDPWAIAAASPLVQQAVEQLSLQKFTFSLAPGAFRVNSEHNGLVGLGLSHASSPSRRAGADLIMTIDPQSRTLTTVQAITAACLEGSLEIHCVILDVHSLETVTLQLRGGPITLPGPRREYHWSFARLEKEIDAPPEPLPYDGWPPEKPGSCYWYYGGYGTTGWTTSSKGLVHYCAQIEEHHSCDQLARTIDLPIVPE